MSSGRDERRHPMTTTAAGHPMTSADRAAARERRNVIADALRARLETLGWSELWSSPLEGDRWRVGGRIGDEFFEVEGNSADGVWYALHVRALEVAEVGL